MRFSLVGSRWSPLNFSMPNYLGVIFRHLRKLISLLIRRKKAPCLGDFVKYQLHNIALDPFWCP